MSDKRKLAVSYGSFACVIEGFDDPFNLMRDIISFYHQVSQDEPEFAHFHEIVDMQELKALLEREMGEDIELAQIAGGVYARRIEAPVQTNAADDEQDRSAERNAAAQPPHIGPYEEVDAAAGLNDDEDGAWDGSERPADTAMQLSDAGGADDGGEDHDAGPDDPGSGDEDHQDHDAAGLTAASDRQDEGDEDDAASRAEPGDTAAQTAEDRDSDTTAETDTGVSTGNEQERHDAEDPDSAMEDDSADEDRGEQDDDAGADGEDTGDMSIAARSATWANDDDAQDDHDEGHDTAPIRLYDPLRDRGADTVAGRGTQDDDATEEDGEAQDAPAAETGRSDAPAPIRLEDAIRSPQGPDEDGETADNDDEDGEPTGDRLTLGDAMRLGPGDAVSGDEGATDGEDAGAEESAGAFIDRVAETEETRDLLTGSPMGRRKAPTDEDSPADLSIAQIRADMEAADDTEKPKKSGGLRMGGLLRRKSAPPAEEESTAPTREIVERRDIRPEATEKAEKPRSLGGGMLRVIRSDPAGSDGEPQDKADHAPRPDPRERAEAPAPQPEPENIEPPVTGQTEEAPRAPAAEDAPAAKAPARPESGGRDSARGGDVMKNRLHASFASKREPSSSKDAVDLNTGELQDPYSPRGFAQRVGVDSITDLMAAAAAFCILVDGRTTITRTGIMETVQMIMGDKPLSAEVKVKAFGKLTRDGSLTRLDGGEFALSPERLESFQQRFDAAKQNNAAG